MKLTRCGVLGCCIALGIGTSGVRASQRLFVSTNGIDAGPCSLAAPCRSFASAVAIAGSGDQVIVLDSGGYGPVIVDKSITIESPPGVFAGISVGTGGKAVLIYGDGVIVTLKGLTIVGQGAAHSGIHFFGGAKLNVENCEISGVGLNSGFGYGAAILAEAPGGTVVVRNTIIRDFFYFGIWVRQLAAGATTTLHAENVAIHTGLDAMGVAVGGDPFGVSQQGTAEVYLTHVTVTGTYIGVRVGPNSGQGALASITNSTINSNAYGIASVSVAAKAVVATSTVAGNMFEALFQSSTGVLLSRGDNTVHDNNSGGAQTSGIIGSIAPL